jgi:hypothetical protein
MPEPSAHAGAAVESTAAAAKTTGGILAGGKGIIAAAGLAVVVIGGIMAAHFAGLITLPLLPERAATSAPGITTQTPQSEPTDSTPGDMQAPNGANEPDTSEPIINQPQMNEPATNATTEPSIMPDGTIVTQVYGNPIPFSVNDVHGQYVLEIQTPQNLINMRYDIYMVGPIENLDSTIESNTWQLSQYADIDYLYTAGATITHVISDIPSGWVTLFVSEAGPDSFIAFQIGD